MKFSTPVLLLILLVSFSCLAQQNGSATSNPAGATVTNAPRRNPAQVEHLTRARSSLAAYMGTVSSESEEYRKTKTMIEDLDAQLKALTSGNGESTATATASTAAPGTATSNAPQVAPLFSLGSPVNGRTNLPVEPALTWSEDQRNGTFQKDPPYVLKRFRVVVARDRELQDVVFQRSDVVPATAAVRISDTSPKGMQSIETTVGVDELQAGTTYYWQVFAVYTPKGEPDTVEFEQPAVTPKGEIRPGYFITATDPFAPLTKRNFSLQRTVDSTDPTEGAQFSFLKTFGGKTVFSTDFAFFWDSRSYRFANNRGFLWFRPAVEGKLTSDDSTAEDAWRFSGSAVLDYNLIDLDTDSHNRMTTNASVSAPRKLIDSLYFEFGGNVESDQGFDTKKLSSRTYFSPSSRKLAIGWATGDVESPIQFVWRPSVEFNFGHTFEPGSSAETGSTIVRLVPKVRMTFYTRALSRALKIANSDFFFDNTFYYLPKDTLKKRHNFFTSGFEVFVIKNFGFGLTYKHGESAPKFKPIHSFGGTLTVRFGPE